MAKYRKAIAGVVGPLITMVILGWAAREGYALDEETVGQLAELVTWLVVAGLTGLSVYFIPNAP